MANADWYPRRLADRIAWHANFSAEATANGTNDGLTGAQVTQIGTDAATVSDVIAYNESADAFAQAFTEYMRIMLDAPLNTPTPTPPTPPAEFEPLLTALAAIQARTRQYAALLRAHPNYTLQKGEAYGIVAPAPTPPGTPAIASATPQLGGPVTLSLTKAGYDVLAVDMRRHGGPWTQIGVSQTANFLDSTANQTPDTPETREYRLQGMIANARTGDVSAIVSVVTLG